VAFYVKRKSSQSKWKDAGEICSEGTDKVASLCWDFASAKETGSTDKR